MNTIKLDLAGLYTSGTNVQQKDFEALKARMREVQREIVETDEALYASKQIPDEKKPLDHGFYRLPEQMLETYRRHRQESELGRVLKIARRLQENVDRVVVLGIGGSY